MSSAYSRAQACCVGSLIAALAISQTGCEWVLGGIPHQPRAEQDGGDDAGSVELDGGPSERDAQTTEDARGPVDDDAGDESDADVVYLDSEIPGVDAEVTADSGADADVDAAPEPCTGDTVWYRDEDGDGFGVAEDALQECPKPPGKWSSRSGDCQDANPDVNPGQVHYFDVPYEGVDGTDSFDYNCDSQEQGSGNQLAGASSCGALALALCDSGSGFAPTARSGIGVDEHCGSRSFQTCKAGLLGALVCGATSQLRQMGYVCR